MGCGPSKPITKTVVTIPEERRPILLDTNSSHVNNSRQSVGESTARSTTSTKRHDNSSLKSPTINERSGSNPIDRDDTINNDDLDDAARERYSNVSNVSSGINTNTSTGTETSFNSTDAFVASSSRPVTPSVEGQRNTKRGHEKNEEAKDISFVHSTSRSVPPPPPLPSTNSNNTSNAVSASTQPIDPYWTYIYQTLAPHILDPEDLFSTLNDIINSNINKLHPVEISFIKRRVKDVVKVSWFYL